eukprot:3691773-Rhodomonas_salina.2
MSTCKVQSRRWTVLCPSAATPSVALAVVRSSSNIPFPCPPIAVSSRSSIALPLQRVTHTSVAFSSQRVNVHGPPCTESISGN